jgi:DNA-directed RNA polymerase sigma subunit (sigma70/sigma32)
VAWDATPPAVDWNAVIEEILAVESPAERARRAGVAFGGLTEEQVALKLQRQACVIEMRRTSSLADIGRELGLHRNRVQQIAEGRSSGGQGGAQD